MATNFNVILCSATISGRIVRGLAAKIECMRADTNKVRGIISFAQPSCATTITLWIDYVKYLNFFPCISQALPVVIICLHAVHRTECLGAARASSLPPFCPSSNARQ